MSAEGPGEFSGLTQRSDEAWDRFEEAWTRGECPRIEDYLSGFEGAERRALLAALLASEVEHRRRRGEHPAPGEYCDRFAGQTTLVDAAFDPGPAGSPDDERSPRGDPTLRIITEAPGSRVGPYKLLREIGQGGMGVVYMAEQETPVRRRVALKIIKPGTDTGEVIARFEAERQALALMDHQHIAKVLDAGATDTRRPYFVMELVKGEPITEYCDRNRLTPRERLDLFVPVCQAIQHAHQKGIIHRDLKPSNVLVTLSDGQPVAKVIDFGMAKAVDQRLTERTLLTQVGQIIGTLEYMSPEQSEMGALDIDTRSDIYSLGVMLYELLTGSTPLERAKLRQAAYSEVLHRIREEEPAPPSTRLGESKDALPAIAARRKTEPARLARLVRGELDWIAMKALEKDRTRRYETANGLARDIQRYLDGDPVEAGPPSAFYRVGRFACKHRAALATVAAFVGLLVAGVLASTVMALRARRAEADARRALAQVRQEQARSQSAFEQVSIEQARTREALTQSEEARRQAEAVLAFLKDDVLSATRPEGREGGLGKDVTVRQAVDAAEPRIAGAFRDQPAVEADIRDTLGTTYHHLRENQLAIQQLERAAALFRMKLGVDHPDTLKNRTQLAEAYLAAGRIQDAIRIHKETLRLQESTLGHDHRDTLITRNSLAEDYSAAGLMDDAIRMHEETIRLQESTLGPDHLDTITTRNNLAAAYRFADRVEDAIRMHEAVLRLREAKLGSDHISTLVSRHDLALAYQTARLTDKAIALHQPTLEMFETKLGPDHSYTIQSRNGLAAAYALAGRTKEAIVLHEANLKRAETKQGPDHPDTLASRHNLAQAYFRDRRFHDAIKLHESNLKLMELKFGPDHLQTLASRNVLAEAYEAIGRWAAAEALRRETLARRRKSAKPDSARLAGDLAGLGWDLLNQERWSEAEPVLRECLEIRAKAIPNDWTRFDAMSQLGGSLLGQGRYADAEPLVVPGYEGMKNRDASIPPPGKPRVTAAAERVVKLYDAWGKKDKAAEWRAKLARSSAEPKK